MASKQILAVDDTAAHLQELKEIIESAGYSVITAASGRDAVDKAKSELPAMIFLDIVMDDLDGYGACREITRNESTKDIPVVFVSTKNQRADKLWAEKQGAKALLSKPIDEADILNYLNKFA